MGEKPSALYPHPPKRNHYHNTHSHVENELHDAIHMAAWRQSAQPGLRPFLPHLLPVRRPGPAVSWSIRALGTKTRAKPRFSHTFPHAQIYRRISVGSSPVTTNEHPSRHCRRPCVRSPSPRTISSECGRGGLLRGFVCLSRGSGMALFPLKESSSWADQSCVAPSLPPSRSAHKPACRMSAIASRVLSVRGCRRSPAGAAA
jgi:hypothetical protein